MCYDPEDLDGETFCVIILNIINYFVKKGVPHYEKADKDN